MTPRFRRTTFALIDEGPQPNNADRIVAAAEEILRPLRQTVRLRNHGLEPPMRFLVVGDGSSAIQVSRTAAEAMACPVYEVDMWRLEDAAANPEIGAKFLQWVEGASGVLHCGEPNERTAPLVAAWLERHRPGVPSLIVIEAADLEPVPAVVRRKIERVIRLPAPSVEEIAERITAVAGPVVGPVAGAVAAELWPIDEARLRRFLEDLQMERVIGECPEVALRNAAAFAARWKTGEKKDHAEGACLAAARAAASE